MYSGSTEFNKLIEQPNGNAFKIRLTFPDFTLDKLTKVEYHGGSNNSNDIAIGTTNMAYLDVSAITDKMITNQEFLLEAGMELSDGTIEYAPMGYFTVQKPDGDEDEVNFTAYDRMQKFEKPYKSNLTYPTDSTKILSEICSMCGVERATPMTKAIQISDKLEGYTCREVLGYIAGILGFFACIDRYGKLNLRWYSETPIEKQIGLMWSLTKSQSDYKVGKITLAKDTETTYTSGTGINGINYSNPYATQAIADNLYASLGGFTYRPCEINMLDDIRLDPWDMIKVTYLDGSVLTIPVMSLEHSFTDGETRVKSFGKTDTENKYNYTGPVTQTMDRMATELLVVNRVVATKVDAEYVNAHAITTDNLSAIEAEIKSAVIEDISAEYADIRLANIDTANIDVAKIGSLFTKVGLIDRATIVDGHITGFLDAVEINADKITAGTLIADRILLKGSESGLLYALNNLGELTSTNIDTLDGTILTQRTVTADKLVANSITANELDVENIFANEAVLNEIFAQNITATGTITGATIKGSHIESSSGEIAGFTIGNEGFSKIGEKATIYEDAGVGAERFGIYSYDVEIASSELAMTPGGIITGNNKYYRPVIKIVQNVWDDNDNRSSKTIFMASDLGLYAEQIDGDLVSAVTKKEETPSGYVHRCHNLGTETRRWEKIYGKNGYYTDLNIDGKFWGNNKLSVNASDGRKISTGADLNNCQNAGTYYCPNADIAKTLANCPYTQTNFRLFVIRNTGSNIDSSSEWNGQQILIGREEIYIRYHSDNGVWGSWRRMLKISDVTSVVNATYTLPVSSKGVYDACLAVKTGQINVTSGKCNESVLWFRQSGNVLSIKMSWVFTNLTNEWVTIGTLPSNLTKPALAYYMTNIIATGIGYKFVIQTNGSILVRALGSSGIASATCDDTLTIVL